MKNAFLPSSPPANSHISIRKARASLEACYFWLSKTTTFLTALKVFQQEFPSEPGTPGPDILLCCSAVCLFGAASESHSYSNCCSMSPPYKWEIVIALSANKTGALACPGTGFLLPGVRYDRLGCNLKDLNEQTQL